MFFSSEKIPEARNILFFSLLKSFGTKNTPIVAKNKCKIN